MKIYKLCLESWAGRTETQVKIIKETKTRYKIELLEDCIKGKKGTELLVPKYAIKVEELKSLEQIYREESNDTYPYERGFHD